MADGGWIWPFVVLTVAAAVTYAWRGLGVALAGRINPGGALFRWVSCVAYALLAALVARMILLPIGPLAQAPLSARLLGAFLGLAAFRLCRQNLLAGVAAAVAGLIALTAFAG
ncbi:AzlD domain-containing protein [Arenibaculum pallidiluteum]|uniref:AzlD domain-containing protein n=1 Tax=Arenibaculum pallidiluteum TaxID=2812559 RepID=UPI002E2B47C2|nr:AzlD domain-containing protein [Arenibaculum pallidiluteum]